MSTRQSGWLWLTESKESKRKELLKALGAHRNFLCMAADVYRPPSKRHSFSKWRYCPQVSNEEQSVYMKRSPNGLTYVIAFRGTSRMHDTRTVVNLVLGSLLRTPRFRRDLAFIEKLQRRRPGARIVLVGHSLGGRLASEIAKIVGVKAVTFNEARGFKDIGKADNNKNVYRYRTRSDISSLFGSGDTRYKLLPGYGHGIRKMQRLICVRRGLQGPHTATGK
jgi:dienelactone hydrolase